MLIILCGYSIISIFVFAGKIDPPKVIVYSEHDQLSYCGFSCIVFKFWDTYHVITLTEEEKKKIDWGTGSTISDKLNPV